MIFFDLNFTSINRNFVLRFVCFPELTVLCVKLNFQFSHKDL